jgi:hypothetical protein
MSFMEQYRIDAESLFNAQEMAQEITYTPVATKVPATIVALVAKKGQPVAGGLDAKEDIVLVKVEDVAEPAHGDLILIGAKEFTVHERGDTRITGGDPYWRLPVISDERAGYRGKRF